MKNLWLEKTTREFKRILTSILILFWLIAFGGTPVYSQGMGMKKHSPPESKQTMTDQISEIRSKLFRLETALEKKHQGKSGVPPAMANKRGMKKIGPMGKMKPRGMSGGSMQKMLSMTKPGGKMIGMMGMKMMGQMNKNAFLPSSLPGFPGVSHIYHMGSSGFFLDHSDHIRLTIQQKTKLNQVKERATLDNAAQDRKAQQLEQDLWVLTSSDQPDIKKVDEKIRAIERLKGNMRLAFIQAVGKAAKILSSEQLELLKGMKHDLT